MKKNISLNINIANQNMVKKFGPDARTITLADIEKVYSRNLLSIDSDAKTSKGVNFGYLTGILYLAPYNLTGVNFCPKASLGCINSCLFTAGRGAFESVTFGRLTKALAFLADQDRFIAQLSKNIISLEKKAFKLKLKPCVRLNGTSDILFEKIGIIQKFPSIQFYDYTKIEKRLSGFLPENYKLTFSDSENKTKEEIKNILERGHNVATVFSGKLPETYLGFPVVDGDNLHGDLRFLDPRAVVVGLVAKGKAKKENSGFVKTA